ncbi:MAG: YaiI/YqxD family protein [Alphaproteobacteria bacterium]|tara:strand:- start:109 stop:558 length:450 start_codon:yes stop_codon:yes gene_type:complete
MVKIYVDADACPVKNEVERVATRHNLETYMVCDGGIRPSLNPLVKLVVVDQGADAADDWIADHIKKSDICVTNDIPLAGRCLKKGAFAIKPNGKSFNDDNIGIALATREIMEKIRETGEMTGGPPPFRKADRSKFLDQMEMIILKAKKS